MAVENFWRRVWSNFNFRDKSDLLKNKEPDLKTVIDEAKLEWQRAMMYLDSVTDPDLVDHAIYSMEAAEKKYIYLLKQAKKDGLKAE